MYQWFLPEVGNARERTVNVDDLAADPSGYGKPTGRGG